MAVQTVANPSDGVVDPRIIVWLARVRKGTATVEQMLVGRQRRRKGLASVRSWSYFAHAPRSGNNIVVPVGRRPHGTSRATQYSLFNVSLPGRPLRLTVTVRIG